MDLFGSQIQGDLIGASQWRIYQGVAKEFEDANTERRRRRFGVITIRPIIRSAYD